MIECVDSVSTAWGGLSEKQISRSYHLYLCLKTQCVHPPSSIDALRHLLWGSHIPRLFLGMWKITFTSASFCQQRTDTRPFTCSGLGFPAGTSKSSLPSCVSVLSSWCLSAIWHLHHMKLLWIHKGERNSFVRIAQWIVQASKLSNTCGSPCRAETGVIDHPAELLSFAFI